MRFADVFERGDVDQIVEMLVEDVQPSRCPLTPPGTTDGETSLRRGSCPADHPPACGWCPPNACAQPALAFYRLEPGTDS